MHQPTFTLRAAALAFSWLPALIRNMRSLSMAPMRELPCDRLIPSTFCFCVQFLLLSGTCSSRLLAVAASHFLEIIQAAGTCRLIRKQIEPGVSRLIQANAPGHAPSRVALVGGQPEKRAETRTLFLRWWVAIGLQTCLPLNGVTR
jgi:hypothetical protein